MSVHGSETRALLLASLKDAISNLTCRTMGEPVKGQTEAQPVPATLDDGVKEVRAVLSAVEQCLFHGLRVEQFKGVHPFWPLLERLESALQPPDHSFNNTVAAIAVVTCLKTPVGKARGWVRQALNTKALGHCVSVVSGQGKYVTAFWQAHALMRCDDGETGLLEPLLQSLSAFAFSCAVEQPDLNHPAPWPILAAQPKDPAAAAGEPSTIGAAAGSARAAKATKGEATGGGGGWVPPRDKWKIPGAGGEGGGGGWAKPQWMSGLAAAAAAAVSGVGADGEASDDGNAAWRAKAKAGLGSAVAALGTTFEAVKESTAKARAQASEAIDDLADEVDGGRAKGGKYQFAGATAAGAGSRAGATQAQQQQQQQQQQSAPRSRRPAAAAAPASGPLVSRRSAAHADSLPPKGVWGMSLNRLARSEAHAELARLCPAAAVPHALASMVGALAESLDTPGLFRKPVSSGALSAVRNWFDRQPRGGVPPGYDPHVVAAALLALLAALPEPLLPFDSFDALIAIGQLACMEGVPPSAVETNLSARLMALPRTHKACLCLVASLMHKALLPEHRELNGATPLLLGLVFAPALLRRPHGEGHGEETDLGEVAAPQSSPGSMSRAQVAQAAGAGAGADGSLPSEAGGGGPGLVDGSNGDVGQGDDDANSALVGSSSGAVEVVRLLAESWPAVGASLEAEQASLARALSAKCLKLEAYQADLSVGLDPGAYEEHDAALRLLWSSLRDTDALVVRERAAAFRARKEARAANRVARAAERAAAKAQATADAKAAKAKAKAEAKKVKAEARAAAAFAKAAAAAAAALKKQAAVAVAATPADAAHTAGAAAAVSIPSSLAVPSAEDVENVTMMGFSLEWAATALRHTKLTDSDAAVDFILEHITDMDDLVAAEAKADAAFKAAKASEMAAAALETAPAVQPSPKATGESEDAAAEEEAEEEEAIEEEEEEEEAEAALIEDALEVVDLEGAWTEDEAEDEGEDPPGGGPDVATSARFRRCGLAMPTHAAGGVASPELPSAVEALRGGGLLVVQCLSHLAVRHPATAPTLIAHAARRAAGKAFGAAPTAPAASSCHVPSSGAGRLHGSDVGVPAGAVAVMVLRATASVLRLRPTPAFNDVSPAAVARTAAWRLLDAPCSVEEVFSLALHVFDDLSTSGSAGPDLGHRLAATEAAVASLVYGKLDRSYTGPNPMPRIPSGLHTPSALWQAWAEEDDDRVDDEGRTGRRSHKAMAQAADQDDPRSPKAAAADAACTESASGAKPRLKEGPKEGVGVEF